MDKAKQAVSSFMSKAGHHDTTVHETVAPAVTNETVTPTRHENVTTAVDKEIHQDHHHTSVQPVHDREVLPEKHTHNLAGVEHRKFDHSNKEEDTQRLQREGAQFKDQRTVVDTKHSQSMAPVVGGEHVHHHVHETIQPVVHKQTIQPNVVHTTVPIHEIHNNAAQHHGASALPALSMEEFKKQGGALSGRGERNDGFEGEPRSIGNAMGSGHSDYHHHNAGEQSGLGSSGVGSTTGHNGNIHDTHKKASLMDKINPKIDADGDGKAGFMK
jgi:hypothetical protein